MRQAKAMKETKMEGGNTVPEATTQGDQSVGGDPAVESSEGFALYTGGKRKSMRKSMRKHKGKSMRKYKKKGGYVDVVTAGLLLAANTMVGKNSTRKQRK